MTVTCTFNTSAKQIEPVANSDGSRMGDWPYTVFSLSCPFGLL